MSVLDLYYVKFGAATKDQYIKQIINVLSRPEYGNDIPLDFYASLSKKEFQLLRRKVDSLPDNGQVHQVFPWVKDKLQKVHLGNINKLLQNSEFKEFFVKVIYNHDYIENKFSILQQMQPNPNSFDYMDLLIHWWKNNEIQVVIEDIPLIKSQLKLWEEIKKQDKNIVENLVPDFEDIVENIVNGINNNSIEYGYFSARVDYLAQTLGIVSESTHDVPSIDSKQDEEGNTYTLHHVSDHKSMVAMTGGRFWCIAQRDNSGYFDDYKQSGNIYVIQKNNKPFAALVNIYYNEDRGKEIVGVDNQPLPPGQRKLFKDWIDRVWLDWNNASVFNSVQEYADSDRFKTSSMREAKADDYLNNVYRNLDDDSARLYSNINLPLSPRGDFVVDSNSDAAIELIKKSIYQTPAMMPDWIDGHGNEIQSILPELESLFLERAAELEIDINTSATITRYLESLYNVFGYTLNQLSPEMQSILLSSSNKAFYWVQETGERNSQLENIIAQDPEDANYYAVYILQSKFPKGEAAIAEVGWTAFSYAQNFGRFELGEPIIAQDPEMACKYAEYVLYDRFKMGESIISTSGWADRYEQNILYPRGLSWDLIY